MRTDIAENLYTIANLLTPEECEQLITRGESIGFEAAFVTTSSGPQMMTNVRSNDRVTFDDPVLAGQLWERVRPHVSSPIAGSIAVGLNEQLRFYRYDPSQRFKAHRDGVIRRSPKEQSRLTFMVYLNEGAEGGQTASKVPPPKGKSIRLKSSLNLRVSIYQQLSNTPVTTDIGLCNI